MITKALYLFENRFVIVHLYFFFCILFELFHSFGFWCDLLLIIAPFAYVHNKKMIDFTVNRKK